MTSQKIAKISEDILVNFTKTGDMIQAYNAVFGAGAYEKLAGDIYDQLRAKAGKND